MGGKSKELGAFSVGCKSMDSIHSGTKNEKA